MAEIRECDLPKAQRSFINVPISHFDGAEATFAYPDQLGGMTAYKREFFGDVKPSDLSGVEWDVAALFMPKGVGPSQNHKGSMALYGVHRIRRVSLSEIRGLFPLKTGVVVEYAQATIFCDGSYTPSREYIEKRAPGWTVVGQPREVAPELVDEQAHKNIEISMGLAFSKFYEWSVKIRAHPRLPSIALTTDPIGAREAFKMREAPSGKSRRDALKHWVSGHWRKQRDSDEASWVAEFMRGATEFTWNGMACQIIPSAYDLMRHSQRRRSA